MGLMYNAISTARVKIACDFWFIASTLAFGLTATLCLVGHMQLLNLLFATSAMCSAWSASKIVPDYWARMAVLQMCISHYEQTREPDAEQSLWTPD